MGNEIAFEYTVRTRQKTDETYAILVEKAPGHWISMIRLPDGSYWTMDRFDPKSPSIPKQWVGATAAAAADFAARILTNYFASEGMEVMGRRYLLGESR
jgi:hypothetical protein